MPYQVLLYYCFQAVPDPDAYAESHRAFCENLGLRGRILLATEGINGTVSGPEAACAKYMDQLGTDFPGIEFKIDPADDHAFKNLYVKVRSEIITLGVPVGDRVGHHLSPAEWHAMMDDEDVVLLDGRNAYESEVGRFERAICPPVQNFRDLPAWLEGNREMFAGKKVLTYCTGGIRCEKLSAWMLDNGFENVFQLHGGIVMYGKDEQTLGQGFDGVNVVFDERVVVSAGPRATISTRCRECGDICANYVNCANVECNLRMIQCERCEDATNRCCSEECRIAPRRRSKGKKWHESARR